MKRPHELKGQRFGMLVVMEIKKGKKGRSGRIWKCKCDCGNISYVTSSALTTGRTKSCGCNRTKATTLPYGVASCNILYRSYKQDSKKRNLEFKITRSHFRKLTSSNCIYCNSKPSNIFNRKKTNGEYIYNGIDRIDNSKGYIIGNVQPCCIICNRMKWIHTEKNFIDHIFKIYKNIRGKKNDI